MLTFRTIPRRGRLAIFAGLAIVDIVTRLAAASLDAYSILFGGSSQVIGTMSIHTSTGLAVPLMTAPLVLAPLAFVVGQIFVLDESRWVRLVSGVFIAASFVVYTVSPALSVFTAGLAYLMLISGMLRSRALD